MTSDRSNVRIHDFQPDAGITSDLDHYTDMGHFGPGISSELLKRMAAGDRVVDLLKVEENSVRIKKQVEALDVLGLENELALNGKEMHVQE